MSVAYSKRNPNVHGSVSPELFVESSTSAARRPTRLMVALATMLAGATIASAEIASVADSILLGVVGVVLAGIASLCALDASPSAHRNGMLIPAGVIIIWTVGYGVASISWRYPDDLRNVTARGLQVEHVPTALALAAIGLLAWQVGYLAFHFRWIEMLISGLTGWATDNVSPARSEYKLVRVCVIYLAGVASRLGLIALDRFAFLTSDLQAAVSTSSPINSVLSGLAYLATVGFFMLAYRSFKYPSRLQTCLLTAFTIVEMSFGLLSGLRSEVILRFVALGLIYFIVRGRIPLRIVVIAVLSVIVLTPFIDTYRTEVRENNDTKLTTNQAMQIIPETLATTVSEIEPTDLIGAPNDFITQRLRFIDEIAIVVQRTPDEFPYIDATDSLVEAAGVFVPRVVWADKPIYTIGLQYARDYWNQPEASISSRSPGFLGESYLRGGWVGVLALMPLLGGAMAATNRALSTRRNMSVTPMFVAAWIAFTNVETSLILLFAGLAQSLLLVAVCLRWAAGGRKPTTS